MKIHHMQVRYEERWEWDPDTGPARKLSPVFQSSDTLSIVHQGETYDQDGDGVFDVPDELGRWLITTPGWFEGPPPTPPKDLEVTAAPARRGPGRPRKEA